MENSKWIFKNQEFNGYAPQTEEDLVSIFNIITDDLNSLKPLRDNFSYELQTSKSNEDSIRFFQISRSCKFIYISNNFILDSLNILNGLSRKSAELLKLHTPSQATNFNRIIEVCPLRNHQPVIQTRLMNKNVKRGHTHHIVMHQLSNRIHEREKLEIESIDEEFIKSKMLNQTIQYTIGVSSEIGFFD